MATKNSGDSVREAVFLAIEASLEAQLRAVRRLRVDPDESKSRRTARKGMSQVSMAEDILRRASGPLHANDIIEQIKKIQGVATDRHSPASAPRKNLHPANNFVRYRTNHSTYQAGKH